MDAKKRKADTRVGGEGLFLDGRRVEEDRKNVSESKISRTDPQNGEGAPLQVAQPAPFEARRYDYDDDGSKPLVASKKPRRDDGVLVDRGFAVYRSNDSCALVHDDGDDGAPKMEKGDPPPPAHWREADDDERATEVASSSQGEAAISKKEKGRGSLLGTAIGEALTDDDIVDPAVLNQNLEDGDRIQVLWTIEDDGHDDGKAVEEQKGGDGGLTIGTIDNAGTEKGNEGSSFRAGTRSAIAYSRWWRATLKPWDGIHREGMAIRSLLYDAYPSGGFPDPSLEMVIFAEQPNRLVTYPGLEPMIFRAEKHLSSDEKDRLTPVDESDLGHIVVAGREGIEQLVDDLLIGALRKNNAQWSKLSAAQQAIIADSVARKKARLLELMEEHLESHDVVSSSDMQRILTLTMETG